METPPAKCLWKTLLLRSYAFLNEIWFNLFVNLKTKMHVRNLSTLKDRNAAL